jgi:hypothetical protein
MSPVVQHLILLLFAASFSLIGWFVAHNPAKVSRPFTFALQSEQWFFVGFVRPTGWCFAIFFAPGVAMYAILMAIDVLRLRPYPTGCSFEASAITLGNSGQHQHQHQHLPLMANLNCSAELPKTLTPIVQRIQTHASRNFRSDNFCQPRFSNPTFSTHLNVLLHIAICTRLPANFGLDPAFASFGRGGRVLVSLILLGYLKSDSAIQGVDVAAHLQSSS